MYNSVYVLGHADAEQQRLSKQGHNLRPFTEQLLRDVTLRPGMRVLDVGCGNGDVTLLAAELVGPSGLAVGIDRSSEVPDAARAHTIAWLATRSVRGG
jgi:ubiquinone/menaquinone biosynthesis C-methylase UbiE